MTQHRVHVGGEAGERGDAMAADLGRLLGFTEPVARDLTGPVSITRIPAAAYAGWGAAYETLCLSSDAPNPFLSPATIAAARQLYPDERIVVLAAHAPASSARRLVGVWAFAIRRDLWSFGLPVLQTPLVPDYDALSHPTLDRAQPAAALAALLDQVRRDASLPGVIQVAHWPERLKALLPADARLSHAEAWPRAVLAPTAPTDAESYLRAAMGSSYKKRLSQERALGRLGRLTHKRLVGGGVREGYDAFLRLEDSGWKGQAGTSLSQHPDEEAYVRAALDGLAQAGLAGVDLLELDGRPIAAGLVVEAGGRSLFWKTAYDEDFARHSPGALLDLAVTRRLFAEGKPALDSGMDAFTDPDTQPWSERLQLSRAVIDLRHGLTGLAARTGQRARHAARRLWRRWKAKR